MFGKIKNWMGIEGAKIRLQVLPSYPSGIETINGELEIYSKRPQRILQIEIKLYEIYSHGTKSDKRIDEYLLGTWESDQSIAVDDNKTENVFFKLPYQPLESNMDKIANKNTLFKGLVSVAKSLKGVKSEYKLEARVTVEGLNWQPFTKTMIRFE
jgi:hypothetical protein